MGTASTIKKFLLGVSAVSMVALSAGSAEAGGFSSRQQSGAGLGFAYAGMGTSMFGIGSMFWNPANITNFEGRRSEWNFTYVHPEFSVTTDRLTAAAGAPNLLAVGVPAIGSGNINAGTLTTASYNSYQVNDRFWIGLQTGVPYGSRTKADQGFSGSMFGSSTTVRTVAVTPTVGIKVTDWLSVGFGVTFQQMFVNLKSMSPGSPLLAATPTVHLRGDNYGIGFTAGATIKPFAGTEISLGYRSSIRHALEGEIIVGNSAGFVGSERLIKANVNLPEIVTLSIAQQLNPQWTITGSAQWTNWSRINIAPVSNRVSGVPVTGLGFRYRDEWFFALGAQYQLNDQWKLRAGVAYEMGPITDETRGVRVLDNDRIWLSLGANYKWSEKLEFDLSYSHVFVKSGRVDIVPPGSPFNPAGNPSYGPGAPQFNGTSKGSLDLISFSVKYRWDDPAPAPVRPVVTKF
jgi:long-chain fatty acid transport protein